MTCPAVIEVFAATEVAAVDIVTPGPPGASGSKWFTGSTAPNSAVGAVGDMYLRANGEVYGPKTLSGWGSVQFTLQPPLSTVPAQALAATATAGSSGLAADAGHQHPFPSASQVGADASGTAAAAMTAHVAAADPHPIYTSAAEASAAAPVQSVAGRTGVVTIGAADVSGLAAVATSGAYADLTGKPLASPGGQLMTAVFFT